MTQQPPVLEALQGALGAEHAAVYVYGVLGAQISGTEEPALRETLEVVHDEHRARRDALTEMVVELGGAPVGAAAAYAAPERLDDADLVRAEARRLEAACQAHYATAVGAAVGDIRRWAVEALAGSAVRVLALRGTPEMFPGAREYANH